MMTTFLVVLLAVVDVTAASSLRHGELETSRGRLSVKLFLHGHVYTVVLLSVCSFTGAHRFLTFCDLIYQDFRVNIRR